ncbi:hypothetical protein FV139_20610 [Parahaliea maris]|uniref:Uncharacterized protein n=1 Tax=Parahaliea maris TaxID=2716870 RepID=A0A5C8ZKU7_9GAMM|nr:hypothetical protein [Parahaliea maris]TXS89083.1 hypothetical protein FV139_20610 [Parahaliea maris]
MQYKTTDEVGDHLIDVIWYNPCALWVEITFSGSGEVRWCAIHEQEGLAYVYHETGGPEGGTSVTPVPVIALLNGPDGELYRTMLEFYRRVEADRLESDRGAA